MHLSRFRFDLGLKFLLQEWRALFTTTDVRADVISGLTVACVAVPLSLAIALAAGVDPAIGLISSIVGGIVCALLGGTPLSVSGASPAMVVLMASTVQTYGLGGLIAVAFGAGVLQVVSGVLGIGRFVRLVPSPVIAGFTAGIGAVILIGQLPRALGLPPPPESETISVLTHIGEYLHQTEWNALHLALLTMVIIFGVPRLLPRVPGTLVAVVIVTAVTYFLKLDTALIGNIPDHLPPPKLPSFPNSAEWNGLVLAMFTVYALGTLESLLSSTAVDKMWRGPKHDSDQELIGQGFGNMVVALFGGIPVTGVIARSALNAQSGGRTRRAAIVHSLALLFAVYFASHVISLIPIAALAGVLLATALRMLNVREFRGLWKVSSTEAGVYLLTFATIVTVDLLVGIQVGVIAALVLIAVRAARTQVAISHASDAVARVQLAGTISFLSLTKLSEVRTEMERLTRSGTRKFVLDLSEVSRVDASAAEELIALVRDLELLNARVTVKGARASVRGMLERADHEKVLADRLVITEAEVHQKFADSQLTGLARLRSGVQRFREQRELRLKLLLERLADDQKPHTLFLTCSDSRINPNLLTETELGELFVVRNVGNAFPPYRTDADSSETGAIEFGLFGLGIREIVICGHTRCGAMKGVAKGVDAQALPSLARYLEGAAFQPLKGRFADPDEASRANVLQQQANLMTYPYVRELVEKGELKIHLWIYDLQRADVDAWNEETRAFEPLLAMAPKTGVAPVLPEATEGLHILPGEPEAAL